MVSTGLVRRCPKCQSNDIRRSRSQGSDAIAILLLLRPYRCLKCWHRYFGFVFAKREETSNSLTVSSAGSG